MDKEDLNSPEAIKIIGELNDLVSDLKSRQLKISSWCGSFDLTGDSDSFERINRGYGYKSIEDAVDDDNFPWFLYWEIIWVCMNNDFEPGMKVLDLGGSSSLFSYYLASKGLSVTTVDLQKHLVDNANFVAGQMQWKLNNHVLDMRKMELNTRFDHIVSICVYEHIPLEDRLVINKNIEGLLNEGGKFSITFDYRNPSNFVCINSAVDVFFQFVKPSGLKTRGNRNFYDNEKSYLLEPFFYKKPLWRYKISSVKNGNFYLKDFLKTKTVNDYTFGALFMER